MEKDQLILEFRLANLAKGLSPKTIKFYDDNLKIFFSSVQEEVTPKTIREFLASKRDKVSPHTLHCYYRTLRRFFNFLREEGYIEDSPIDKVQSPKLPKLQPRFLNKDEIRRFFSVIKSKRDYAFFLFLLDTGARLSEALNLRISDVDLEYRRAFIKGKGSKERFAFFGGKCSKALARYLFHHRPESLNNLVFVSSSGRQLDSSNINHICKRIAKRANLRGVHIHTFRHSMATQFLINGGNLIVLQRLLGHSSLEMVNRYAHLTTDSLANQYAKSSPVDSLFR